MNDICFRDLYRGVVMRDEFAVFRHNCSGDIYKWWPPIEFIARCEAEKQTPCGFESFLPVQTIRVYSVDGFSSHLSFFSDDISQEDVEKLAEALTEELDIYRVVCL